MIRDCHWSRTHWVGIALVILAAPCALFGKDVPEPTPTPKMLAINVLIGGLSAGAGNAAAGRSFWTGFVKGSGGGAVVFAGKRVIAEKGAIASWAGRLIAAAGSSQVRNAGAGRRMMEELVFPVGLARLYVTTKDRTRFAAKLDLTAAIGTIAMSQRPGASFDPAASVTHGAIIFTSPWLENDAPAALRLGVIRVFDIPLPVEGEPVVKSAVIAHELVHAAQYDFISIAWSEPLEKWALSRNRAGKVVHRYVDFSALTYLWTGMHALLPADRRPWEREAISLAPGR